MINQVAAPRENGFPFRMQIGTNRVPEWHPVCSVGEENQEKEKNSLTTTIIAIIFEQYQHKMLRKIKLSPPPVEFHRQKEMKPWLIKFHA